MCVEYQADRMTINEVKAAAAEILTKVKDQEHKSKDVKKVIDDLLG